MTVLTMRYLRGHFVVLGLDLLLLLLHWLWHLLFLGQHFCAISIRGPERCASSPSTRTPAVGIVLRSHAIQPTPRKIGATLP